MSQELFRILYKAVKRAKTMPFSDLSLYFLFAKIQEATGP